MILDIFLPLSLVFIMFTLGLGLTLGDFTNIFREPKAFAVGLTNQMLVLPLVAFIIINLFGLTAEMAVGMMILSCCPGGVTSNMITKLANGDTALSISYTAVASIVTVFTLPLIIGFSMDYFMGADAPPINILTLGITMCLMTALPVGVGLFVNTKYNGFSKSFEPRANTISTILFVILVVGALASNWDIFINNLSVLGPAIILLISTMLFIGYNSGHYFKMNAKQALTVAIESGIQNATVGITVGNIIMNVDVGLSPLSLPSGVYGILMYLVCLPFLYWISKRSR
ncbi:MAG: bile acid:sodium symporter family protein [Candidatus Marinimicrobia bacterium]|nr:bile acid:sodium symporter family protein [Candidatus Neomarinimicrobiota bacterium]